MTTMSAPATPPALSRALYAITAAIILLHLATNGRYGFHRDELQFLSDAQHLDWGFVAYPPLTAFLEHISLGIFGINLVGLRLFSVLFQGAAILFTGLIARDLGGRQLAQAAAGLSVALSPLPLFQGTEFQYSSFDYFWWVLAAWGLVRLLRTDNPRWWLAVGAALGFGLLTKYSIVFYIAGILGALLLTSARKHFLSRWFWAGVGVAMLLFLPNLLWQIQHHFISYDFLQHIHVRDVGQGRADGFFGDQFRVCANLFAAPLWIAGLVASLRSPRYRMLAWMYLIPLALFVAAKGRGYYLAAAYPMLFAMGAVAAEHWLSRLSRLGRNAVAAVFFAGVTAIGVFACAVIVPLAPSGPLRDFALARNGDLREELGWDTLLQSVAGVRDTLSPQQQSHLGIVVGNYGERGAIDLFGPVYHLPPAITGTNSGWLNSYPHPEPTTLIILGVSDEDREAQFTGCRFAAQIPYPVSQNNEEAKYHPRIYVCGPPRLAWPELWKVAQSFG